MDAQSYNAALADLRTVRDKIKKVRAELTKLETDRHQRITQLATYGKAKAERIAPAAGLSVADVVAAAPALAPESLAGNDDAPPLAPTSDTTTPRGDTEPEPVPQPEAVTPAASASQHSQPAPAPRTCP
jgi:hypothetical protein